MVKSCGPVTTTVVGEVKIVMLLLLSSVVLGESRGQQSAGWVSNAMHPLESPMPLTKPP